MDSIRVGSSVKRIAINDDETRVIEFNPGDVGFAERFYNLMRDLEKREAEYQERAELIVRDQAVDEHGVPMNVGERIAFIREVCEYMYSGIDQLFGKGASQTIFQGATSLDMIGEFFDGIIPFIQAARSQKINKYAPPPQRKGPRPRVMR